MAEQEINSNGEVESALQLDSQPNNNKNNNNNPFPSLGRQSSIYSLTLDEFQHTLCGDGGKNFGSMNMDEFLNSIWTAEENQHPNPATIPHTPGGGATTTTTNNASGSADHSGRGISKQPSLPRQGSLTLPEKLCRKTVDEVWSEIHNGNRKLGQQRKTDNEANSQINVRNNSESTPRQPTFGEMTLEDFLIKAGVVREQQCGGGGAVAAAAAAQSLLPPQQYGMYQTAGPANGGGGGVPAGFLSRSLCGGGGSGGSVAYPPQPPPPAVYGGRVGNGVGGGGSYAPPPPPPQSLAVVGPVSPVSSDGMVAANVDAVGNHYGIDMGGLRGRKRIIDGPVEKVVERRQRRMIKNRESAARSRARKQAYTVELEAELNQLKEENRQLKQALVRDVILILSFHFTYPITIILSLTACGVCMTKAEMERKRKQQLSCGAVSRGNEIQRAEQQGEGEADDDEEEFELSIMIRDEDT
ncbi:Protein ABSCISIC ACID-INSENSITIVE 5 [Linum perenne]